MDAHKRKPIRYFWFALALLFLFESWIWDHVRDWLRALGRRLGVERLEPALADFVARHSPYAALAIFAVPAICILPLKLIAVGMIAHGHVLAGIAVIFLAKSLALGVSAFLFEHTRDKLLQLPWFARFYGVVLEVRAWAHRLVDPVRRTLHEATAAIRAKVRAAVGEGRSLFLHKVGLLRNLVGRDRA